MRPTNNAIFTARIIWRDAKIKNTRAAWWDCAAELSCIAFYVEGSAHRDTDYQYLRDMSREAIDMMEDQ
jgi:hypothetical protein